MRLREVKELAQDHKACKMLDLRFESRPFYSYSMLLWKELDLFENFFLLVPKCSQ